MSSPPVSYFLKKAAGVDKASSKPGMWWARLGVDRVVGVLSGDLSRGGGGGGGSCYAG